MFQKSFELCDVVSLLLQNQENGYILLTSLPTASPKEKSIIIYRFPCVKVVNEEWKQTAEDLTQHILGKATEMSLLKLYKVWIPMHAQKYIHHVLFLVNVPKDLVKKYPGANFKVRISTHSQNK